MKYYILLFVIYSILLIFESCYSSKREINRRVNFYRIHYGTIKLPIDTIIYQKNLKLIYKEGRLTEAGYLKNGKKDGNWFLFGDSIKLQYVLRYKGNKVDTLRKPFILINQSW